MSSDGGGVVGDNGLVSDLFSLEGRFVRLAPMERAHADGLLEVANQNRTTFAFTPVPWDRTTMTDYVDSALARRDAGTHYPFVTYARDSDRILGSTRFYDMVHWDWSGLFPDSDGRNRTELDCVSIGYTWLHPSAQRSPVNTEAKLLMLDHAFERWGVRAVRLQTDARNTRSRAAIERLGCVLDGVIRADRPAADGTVRDTAVYSLLAGEWPPHRRRLSQRLVT
jgi:RimJ/RimL family protein N-acetyltransferase